jgi:predicted nucleic acid-binding Zn ribbon protein
MPWDPLPTGGGDQEPAKLGVSLDRLVRNMGAPSVGTVGGVFANWAEIVGEQVAAHSRPLSMRDGALVVAVDDPAWAPQLRFLEAEVLARVHQVTGNDELDRVEVKVRPPTS